VPRMLFTCPVISGAALVPPRWNFALHSDSSPRRVVAFVEVRLTLAAGGESHGQRQREYDRAQRYHQ
ncbi:hypothetical protein, partial [Novosphingobium naphthalenivorans]|uniref:hypothetical protein n=1 Tax=Novosphingobium naphthalenivorans TaxID=273168 RepID=UPI001C3F4701